MKYKHLTALSLCFAVLCNQGFAQNNTADSELTDLASKLATQIKASGKKKITVLDFTDLQSGTSELGRYIAEQLTVNLVIAKKDYSVLDRANLKSILAEHKLTATGLIDPENAKKLGQFAGVDAIILGTVVPINQNIQLTAKIITTETAEIVGAAKAQFRADDSMQQLLSKAADSKSDDRILEKKEEERKVGKAFGDVIAEVQSLRISDGKYYLVSMQFLNKNPKKSTWIALSGFSQVKCSITDPEGFEFTPQSGGISGIVVSLDDGQGIVGATEIKPNDSQSVTIKFSKYDDRDRAATKGVCRVQVEFYISPEFKGGDYGSKASLHNFVTQFEAK